MGSVLLSLFVAFYVIFFLSILFFFLFDFSLLGYASTLQEMLHKEVMDTRESW